MPYSIVGHLLRRPVSHLIILVRSDPRLDLSFLKGGVLWSDPLVWIGQSHEREWRNSLRKCEIRAGRPKRSSGNNEIECIRSFVRRLVLKAFVCGKLVAKKRVASQLFIRH